MAFVKKSCAMTLEAFLGKQFDVDSDSYFSYQANLKLQRRIADQLEWAVDQGLIPAEDLGVQLRFIEEIRYQMRVERKRCARTLRAIEEIGRKSSSIVVWQSACLLDARCYKNYSFFNKVFKMIYEVDLKHQHKQILKSKLQKAREGLKLRARHAQYLPLIDLEPDFTYDYDIPESFDDVVEASRVKHQQVHREDDYSIMDRFRRMYRFEPEYSEKTTFKNLFLVKKMRAITESFRRLRLPLPTVFRSQYLQRWSPLGILRNWYNSDVPLDDCIDAMELLNLEEIPLRDCIEYPLMPEDPGEVIYPDDYIVCNKLKRIKHIVNEMDKESAHGDCDQLNVEQKENVILTTHAEPAITEPITVTPGIWEQLCSPQKVEEYTQLMSRWQFMKRCVWNTDQARDTNILQNYTLPLQFIKDNLDSPSCLLFKTYSYFRSDLEIKVIVNTNKFHCGQLQASFYYGASLDQHYKDRENVFSASQLPSTIIDAATASDAILRIPYRHYKPLMATSIRPDDNTILDMGVLRLLVLNKLRAPGKEKPLIDVNIYIRFVKPSFHGMKPRTIGKIEGEMMGMAALVKETANLVNQIYPDPQRDNPTDVIPPKPVVPWSAHSWCLGDVCPEPTNVLRLQATGNTPHMPGTLVNEPEMDLKYLQRVFGLIKQIDWGVWHAQGAILAKIPFSPVLDRYPETIVSNPDARSVEVMPSLSVVANLFAYWRGSIEYRLDFVSTQFHTGRLIIAFVPRVVLDRDPTLEELSYCDNVVVDLRDEKQVNYVNSFLSDKPWYPRRKYSNFSTEVYPPGYIYIGVLNALTATASVANTVTFNMYMRGGEDFEVHVPVNPSIGLSFNTKIIETPYNTISYLSNYGPPYTSLYIGQWHSVSGLVFRYGPTSDHVTQFNKPGKWKRIYKLEQPSTFKFVHPQYPGRVLNYLVLFTLNDGYVYGAPFDTSNSASRFANALDANGYASPSAQQGMLPSGGQDGAYVPQNVQYLWKATISEDWVFAEAGDDERMRECGSLVDVQAPLKSTNSGLLTFGEKITSVKQLVRRYMPYGTISLTRKGNSDPTFADGAFPVLPQGLDLTLQDPTGNEFKYGNRIRDGPIPIIASAYRFFRGSIRFRLIVTGKDEGVVWLQHRPEYNIRALGSYKPSGMYAESMYQPGYASMIQLTRMNNVIEFEVPFYLPGQFGMLQRPNLNLVEDAVHYSLGTIYIGYNVMKDKTVDVPVEINIFYSMGDDMTFSVFQGFPPMIDLSVFNKPLIQAEGLGDRISLAIKNKIAGSVTATTKEKIIEVINETAENMDNQTATPADTDGIMDAIKKIFPDLDSSKQVLLLNLFTNLVHCTINPSVATIAWSIASMFVTAGIMCYSFIEKICNSLKNLIKSMLGSSKKSEKEPGAIHAEGPSSPDEQSLSEAAFVSTCVTGILAMAGAADKPLPKSIPQFSKFLYEGMPKFTFTANGLFTFLKNNVKMFKSIWFWIISKFNKDYILYTELNEAPEKVVEFVKQIQWSLDARNLQTVRKEPKATIKVYELANIAQSYLCKKAATTVKKHMPLFESYCHKIIKLRDTLSEEMLSPAIRFEPFVISFNGDSNVGKSHLAQRIAEEMMTAISYKTYDELVYTRTPGNQYWNGLRNQPVCLFDDFLNIEDPVHALVQVGELYCLKSKAVFNPPMAAIEEKKIRYNPLLVLLCNNKAFPHIEGLALQEAWMRRRDLLIEVKKLPEYLGVHPRDMDRDVKKNYKHLRFCPYKNPAGLIGSEQQTVVPPNKNLDGWMTFEELNAFIGKRFLHYFEEECIQYDQAVSKLQNFYPDSDESTDAFCKRVEIEVSEINNSRMRHEQIEEINQLLQSLHANRYTADMTSYVKKKLVEQKVEAFKKEKELSPKKIAEKQLITVVKSFETNVVEAAKKVPPNPTKKQTQQSIPPPFYPTSAESLAFATSSPSSSTNPFDSGFVRAEGPDDWYAIANDYAEVTFDSEFLDKNKFAAAVSSKLESMQFSYKCKCGVQACIATAFYPYDSTSSIVAKLDASDFARTRNARQHLRLDQEVLVCEGECIWDSINFVKWISDRTRPSINAISQHYMAEKIIHTLELAKRPETMALLTEEEADVIINKEVNDRKWYEKLWHAIPGFGTIFKFICKFGALLVAVGTVIRLAGYFFGAPQAAEASYNSAVYSNKYWQNNLQLEENLSTELIRPKDLAEVNDTFVDNMVKAETGYGGSGIIGAKPHVSVPIKALAQASEQQELVINKIIQRNTFWLLCLYTINGVQHERSFRCLGVHNRYFIIIDHYLYFLQTCDNLKLFFVKENISVPLEVSIINNVRKLKDSALCIGKLPNTKPSFKSIIKFFIHSHQTSNIPPGASLYEYVVDTDKGEFCMKEHVFSKIVRRDRIEVNNDDGSLTLVNSLYSYPHSGRGKCGSVLVTNMNCPNPILGIHIAGVKNSQEGYAEAVVYETLAFLLNESKEEPIAVAEASHPSINDCEPAVMSLTGNIELVGCIPRSEACYPMQKSRVCNTECAGEITPITYDVPVLTSKDERISAAPFSPLLKGCEYHTNPCFPMEDAYVERAVEDVTDMLLAKVKPVRVGVGMTSLQVAICGIVGQPLYEGLPMDTSEGFPWIKQRPRGFSNKSWMFEIDEDRNLLSVYKPLLEKLEYNDNLRRNLNHCEPIFVDTLKDAKLPKEKVLLPGKTRIFSVSPVDFSIALRQYTLDFMAAYTSARLETEHAVGIDMHGYEVDKLVCLMMENGNNHVCGDYSKFGDQLYSRLIYVVFDIIIKWYVLNANVDEGFKNVLRCFAEETAHANHLMINLVYKTLGGMPSGNPLTVIINSIVNCCYVRIVWQKIMVKVSLRYVPMSEFRKNVRVMTYGDDLWMSVTDEVKDFYNAESMQKAFYDYNIKFTNATKGDSIVSYAPLSSPDVTFLKATFVKHERRNIWVARLDKRAVEEICNWTWTTQKDIRKASVEACEQMCKLAVSWGDEYYSSLRRKVLDYWINKGEHLSIPDWESEDVRLYDVCDLLPSRKRTW